MLSLQPPTHPPTHPNSFRFVLSPLTPPAHPALYDSECIVDWDYVDLVALPSTEGTLDDCPVCLDTPRAPKLTKCGHIFCAPCILRHLDEYRVRRCPMCSENVTRGDLRPVEVTTAVAIEPNARLEFQLLARVKGTLTPKVVCEGGGARGRSVSTCSATSAGEGLSEEREEGKSPSRPIPQGGGGGGGDQGIRDVLPEVGTVDAVFCRLLSASEEHEAGYLAREEAELREIKAESVGLGETEWVPFVDEALRELEDRRARYAARRKEDLVSLASAPYLPPGATPASPPTPRSASKGNFGGRSISPTSSSSLAVYARARGQSMGSVGESSVVSCDEGCGAHEAKALPASDAVSYLYQVADGQYVFLHSLNMKCLMADAGGAHARLPERVEGKVLEVEKVVLSPEVRARYGFLKHLPLYSQVQLVELDLRPPCLSSATYELFKPEIKKRATRRKNKERADARERKLAALASGEVGALRGIGLTEEEIREIKERRESVDLDGPLPWQAMLIGEEKDPEKVQEQILRLREEGGGVEGATDGEGGGGETSGTSPPAPKGSFAEITRKNGHFPALREEMFPALGGGGPGLLSSSPPSSSSTAGASSSPWGAPVPSSGGPPPVVGSPPLDITSPSSTGGGGGGVWGSRSNTSSNPSSPPPHMNLGTTAWGAAASRAGSASGGGASAPPELSKQKKGKGKGGGKGVSIFSTGSQRSYG